MTNLTRQIYDLPVFLMRMKALHLLFLIIASTVGADQSSLRFEDEKTGLRCIPNSVFTYDHNVCYCDKEGETITCKRQMYSMVYPQLNTFQLQNVTIECVPGKYFKHLCKECICHCNGKYASCISSGCSKEETVLDNPQECVPGSVFKKLCNACICGSDGKAACTNLDCGILGWKENITQCVPGSFLKLACNDCDCAKDGKSMFCDRNGCGFMTFYHEHILNVTITCESNKIFDYNCHQCFCHESGQFAMCSGKQCPYIYDLERVEDTIEECNPGMIFANDCNVCICDKNKTGVCTTFNCDIPYKFKYVENVNFALPDPYD